MSQNPAWAPPDSPPANDPQPDGALNGLRELLNVDDRAWPLILAWQISQLFGLETPIATFTGLSDAEVQERWAQVHGDALAGLLDLAVEVLACLPLVRDKLSERPRMASFAC